MSEANAGSDDDDDGGPNAVPADSNRSADVRDELIAILISQNEILTNEEGKLTAKIDELTKRPTWNEIQTITQRQYTK